MKRAVGIAMVGALLAPPAAWAGEKLANATPDRNAVVCKVVSENDTTLLRRKVCMTRGEWEQKSINDRAELDGVQKRALSLSEHM